MYTIEDFIFGAAPPGAALACPFHGDRRPSAVIQPDTGVFYCYVCRQRGTQREIAAKLWFGEFAYGTALLMADTLLRHEPTKPIRGDGDRQPPDPRVFTVIDRWHQVCAAELHRHPQLVDWLAKQRAIQRPAMHGIGYATPELFRQWYGTLEPALREEPVLVAAGLLRPNMDDTILPHRKFRLGARWILPERRNGRAVHYTARATEPDAVKYLNPPIPKTIYGLESLRRSTDRIWIVEGAFDLLPLLEAGESAVAVSGAHLNDDTLALLVQESRGRTFLVAFDNDPPDKQGVSVGQAATAAVVAALRGRDETACPVVPRAKDIGEWMVRDGVSNVIADVLWNL